MLHRKFVSLSQTRKSFLAIVGSDVRKLSMRWPQRTTESCSAGQVKTLKFNPVNALASLGFCCGLILSAGAAHGDTLYDASLGTLPQSQQFTYSGDQGNDPPMVAGGLLLENKTQPNTAQYWSAADTSIDFSSAFGIEASLLVNSSNFVQNGGDGSSREGYYLFAADITGRAYTVGITSSGVVLNDYPSGHVIPYTLSNGFHTYDLLVSNSLASLSIDGVVVASDVAPESAGIQGVTGLTSFGAAAGASVSNTELSFFCSSDSGSSCAPTPEPDSWLLLFTGLAMVVIGSRKTVPTLLKDFECKSRFSLFHLRKTSSWAAIGITRRKYRGRFFLNCISATLALTSFALAAIAQTNNVSGNFKVNTGNLYQNVVVPGWRDGLIFVRGSAGYTIGMGSNGTDLQFGNVAGGLSDPDVKMTIAGTGNVGIGNTSPVAALSLGPAAFGSEIPNNNLWISGRGGTVSTSEVKNRISLGADPNQDFGSYFGEINGDGGGGQIAVIGTRAGGGDMPALYVREGNVGIGMALPAAKLDVAGNIRLEGGGSGITFPDGSVQTTASVRGSQGPAGPAGPQGVQGIPGPPAHTSAVASTTSCSNVCVRGVSSQCQTQSASQPCIVTSDTGTISQYSPGSYACVCRP
jgi:hypothetical protein